ncbi:hypothetical protein A203_00085 [Chromobacterium violaceum]
MVCKFFLLFTILLSGCATVDTPENSGLKKVSYVASIDLKDGLVEKMGDTKSFFSMSAIWGLMPGLYKADMENELGVFFLGDGYCFYSGQREDLPYRVQRGGIWMPKDKTKSARMFSIFEAGGAQMVSTLDELARNPYLVPRGGYASMSMSGAVGGAIGVSIVQAMIDSDEREADGKRFFVSEFPKSIAAPKLKIIQSDFYKSNSVDGLK